MGKQSSWKHVLISFPSFHIEQFLQCTFIPTVLIYKQNNIDRFKWRLKDHQVLKVTCLFHVLLNKNNALMWTYEDLFSFNACKLVSLHLALYFHLTPHDNKKK